MISIFFLQMLASGGFVTFRAMQTINITKSQYWWILPTSLCIALCEVYVIQMISASTLPKIVLVLSTGTGGALGCYLAMWIMRKFGGK